MIMEGSWAVIAHFDADNRLDPTLREVIECIEAVCERIVLVSTSNLPSSEWLERPSVHVIQRPNIGYDFYSYRVGIDYVRRYGCRRLFLLNSSFLILDRQRFIQTLMQMCALLKPTSVVGLTESQQFELHIQSYLMLLGGDVLTSYWFSTWLDQVNPCNNKIETIIAGELGLTRALVRNGVSWSVLCQLSLWQKLTVYWQWGQRLFNLNGGNLFRQGRLLGQLSEYNPVHFAARTIAYRYGLVKTELLRNNPHGLDISWARRLLIGDDKGPAREFVHRSRRHYSLTEGGLTVLNRSSSGLPGCQIVCSGPLARPGVSIAVVVHVFYLELLSDICVLLRNMVEPFDLIVTTPHEGAISKIIDTSASLAQSVAVAICENRGRDIGPFVAIHRLKLLEPYQAVLKLHTKRSTYSERGEYWRQSLFRELCGSSYIANKAVGLLRSKKVGIVGPHDNYLSHPSFWGADRENARLILEATGIHYPDDDIPLGFFAGSMFWFNPKAMKPLHLLPEGMLAFEPELGQQDGTLAHAFERIFCNVARSAGYAASSIVSDGAEVDLLDTNLNAVPVLSVPYND